VSNQSLTVQFFLQLAVVLLACRIVGQLMARIGQPKVVGEMIAGILLGPSLLGLIAPSVHAMLFPPESLGALSVVSQLGLVLYMFVVGTELQTDFIRQAMGGAALISLTGIVAPFLLGAAIAVALHANGSFFAADVSAWQAMVYFGAAMSVTAFPVLARIIQERGIAGTALGTLALTAGAAGDVVAWCLLAIVLAGLEDRAGLAVTAIAGGVFYTVVVLTFGKSYLTGLSRSVNRKGALGPGKLGVMLSLLMAGAWFTDFVGVHAVFGAFTMGVTMPRGLMTEELKRHLGPVSTALLVPLFFAYSGLSTEFALLWSRDVMMVTVVVVLIASLAKGGACWAAARMTGRTNRESMALGALMNARGLMELIILNIGLERGIITPMLFTIMVMMTLVTTIAAGPVFEWHG
jgi:Kef-type K+ transport system membrane component KefB